MSTTQESRKAARARRRTERKATRQRRRDEHDASKIAPGLTATPDDPAQGKGINVTMSGEALRREKTFKLIARTQTELVVCREGVSLALFSAAPGTDNYDDLGRQVEALNDEIDDLRELSDDLLRQVQPLVLSDDRLAQLERVVSTARELANASTRAKALLGAAKDVLTAIDDALDDQST